MTLTALITVLGLLAVLLLIAAVRNFRCRRIAGGFAQTLISLLFAALAASILLIAANLHSYQRLTAEQPAGELSFTKLGYHQYNGVFTFPDGETADFALRGDEWQVDARVLKWRPLANFLGFDTAYRLERISGRYTDIEDERKLPRTVYPLNPPDRIDIWGLLHNQRAWAGGVDALYGSATFLPMSDGASYEIKVSQSGLLARPLNQAARAAVGTWQ